MESNYVIKLFDIYELKLNSIKYIEIKDLLNLMETCKYMYENLNNNIILSIVYKNTWRVKLLEENIKNITFWKELCMHRLYMESINQIKNKNYLEKYNIINCLSEHKNEIQEMYINNEIDETAKELFDSTYFIPIKCHRKYKLGGYKVIDRCILQWIIYGKNYPVYVTFRYNLEGYYDEAMPWFDWRYSIITQFSDLKSHYGTHLLLEYINEDFNIKHDIELSYTEFITALGYSKYDIKPSMLIKYLCKIAYILPRRDEGIWDHSYFYDFPSSFITLPKFYVDEI